MSISIMSQVFENTVLSPTEKLIMLALADHANDEGKSIYPSQSRLSRKTGLARGTINRHIQSLIDLGYLKSTGFRADLNNVLELEIQIVKLAEKEGVTESDTSPKSDVTESDTRCHGELQPGVTESDTNHHIKHQLNKDSVVKDDDAIQETDEQLLMHFEDTTKIFRPVELRDPYQLSKWFKEIGKWTDMGVTIADITAAVKEADQRGTTLSWPGSITSYLVSAFKRNERGVKPPPANGRKGKSGTNGKANSQRIEEMIANGKL